MGKPKTIMLVCMGNTCRSPMAEIMLKKAIKELMADDAENIKITSAGVFAVHGDPPSHHAMTVMEEMGIDLSSHKSRGISREMIEQTDLILTMTSPIKERLIRDYPNAKEKIKTLAGFANLTDKIGHDIEDPYGFSIEAYRSSANQISRAINIVAKRIKDLWQD